MRRAFTLAAGIAAVLAVTAGSVTASGGAPKLHIEGNRFVDETRAPLRLLGANRMGAEFTCVSPLYDDWSRRNWFGGPIDDRAIAAMASWKSNAVRIPLNEQCWLGVNPIRRYGYSERTQNFRIEHVDGEAGRRLGRSNGASYRRQVVDYVKRLNAQGFIVILDLHLTAPGRTLAFAQFPLSDLDHSPDFWRSVAKTFKHNRSVVFELFNEPNLRGGKLTWSCLRDGCTLPNRCADCDGKLVEKGGEVNAGCSRCPTPGKPQGRYRAAGMQALLDTVRATGAQQPVIVPGLDYTNDLRQWLKFRPKDPLNQVAASFHAYPSTRCSEKACWDSDVAPVAKQVPIVATEFGPYAYFTGERTPCDASFDEQWMSWADASGVSYLPHVWFQLGEFDVPPGFCTDGLITDWYTGEPRDAHGAAVHDHYAALSGALGGGRLR